MIAKQQSDDVWKVSLRSRGDVNVGRVARELGGGGHEFLAGLVYDGDVGELVSRISATVIARGSAASDGQVIEERTRRVGRV
jgi:phosphoesterase RecJ-like protein